MHRSPDGPTANGAAPAAGPRPDGGVAAVRPDGRVTDIDGARFRAVLGRFATGVVAITGIDA
ncbi:flavin reductase, partial [Spirillospora sp. NPDC049652]